MATSQLEEFEKYFKLVKPEDVEEGNLIHVEGIADIPLTLKEMWSGFDDFYAISAGVAMHPNTELVLGGGRPANGVGAEIVFKFKDGETREVLWQKDDLNHIWVIGIPEANVAFKYYRGTFSIWEGPNGTRGKYAVDGILVGDEKTKKTTITNMSFIGYRVLDMSFFVLRRDGTKSVFEFELDVPIQQVYDVVANWDDISWLLGGEKVEKLEKKFGLRNRRVTMANQSTIEELLIADNSTAYTMSYYLYKSSWPLKMYVGNIALSCLPNNRTKFHYDSVYLPKEGADVAQFKTTYEEAFNTKNIPFLKQRFASHHHHHHSQHSHGDKGDKC